MPAGDVVACRDMGTPLGTWGHAHVYICAGASIPVAGALAAPSSVDKAVDNPVDNSTESVDNFRCQHLAHRGAIVYSEGMTNTQTHQYAHGTSLTVTYPFGWNVSARAMCPDGTVRAVNVSATADTFFSIPASVQFKGTRVSGYITIDESDESDESIATRNHAVVKFIAYKYGRNSGLFTASDES